MPSDIEFSRVMCTHLLKRKLKQHGKGKVCKMCVEILIVNNYFWRIVSLSLVIKDDHIKETMVSSARTNKFRY